MINLYFSRLDRGRKIIDEIIKELEFVNKVSIKEFFSKEGFNQDTTTSDWVKTVVCVTPSTYNENYISEILKKVVDNPKSIIIYVHPSEINENGYLTSYQNYQRERLKEIKKAFVFEEEYFFESLYGLKKYLKQDYWISGIKSPYGF